MKQRARTFLDRKREYDEGNLEVARLIVAEPERHGGIGSGPHVWALMVLERLGSVTPGAVEKSTGQQRLTFDAE
jgi:hypothetical protein